jgi:amino acid adenylation domain-containing protein
MSNLVGLISESARLHHDLVAVKIQDNTITYQELLDEARQVAAALKNHGANREAVGIVGQRHIDSYVGVLGVMLADCYYVPINPKLSKDKIISIINDSNINLLVGDFDNFSRIEKHLKNVDYNIIIPSELTQSIISNEDIFTNTRIDELAYVLYTSGSTGHPKGVKVSHFNVVSFLENMKSIYPLKASFRASQMFDFSFDPSVSDMFFTWCMGGTLCVPLEGEIMAPYDFIRREKITFWNSVPSIIGFMKKMGYLSNGVFPSIKYSMFCGEQFPKHYADAWRIAAPNSTIENLYGPTEATIYTSRYLYPKREEKEMFCNNIIPIGEAFPSMKIEIINDSLNKNNSGEIGEIVYKGPQVTQGYLNDENKTNYGFVQFDWDKTGDIWYKSGDLGFINKSGSIECIGRKDNQIKLGGRRIEIGEIEAALSKFNLLQDVVVVPIKNDDLIITGCVAFTMSEISKEDQILLRHQSATHLEQVFFPKKIVKLEQFPRSPSGKIDRNVLSLKAKNL